MGAIDQLQQTEAECLRRFRKKAAQIQALNPQMTAAVAFAKAVEQLPRTAERYQHTRHRLLMAGIAALPLR
jgi:hypothetical protein